MSRIERTNEKHQRALAKHLNRLSEQEPEAEFDNVDDMLKWLDAPAEPPRKTKSR